MQLERLVAESRSEVRKRRLQAVLFVVLAVGLSVLAQVIRTQQPVADRGSWQVTWGAAALVGVLVGVFLSRQELARSATGQRVNGLAAIGAGLVFFVVLPRMAPALQAGGLGLLAGALLGAALTPFLFLSAPETDA